MSVLSRKSGIVATAVSVFLLLVLRFAMDQGAESYYQILQPLFSLFLVVAGGFIALTVGLFLGDSRAFGGSATLRLLTRLSESPARNFLVGFFLTGYVSLIRPPIAMDVPFLPYVEWTSIVIAIYALYSITGFSVKESYLSPETLSWRKHVQEVNRETATDFTHLTSLMERFVDQGVKEPLLISFTLYLQRLGETEEDILKLLDPLVNYRESAPTKKSRSWASLKKKGKPAANDKKAREELLKALMNDLKGLQQK
jgi:hypothetical protein